jgi:HlyD family secretion protein
MFKPKVVLALSVVALALAACSSGASPGAPSAANAPTPTPRPAPAALEKPTYTVQRGLVADQLKLSGRVSATLDEDVFFTQDGFVKTIFVKRTDVVTKGALLAELDLGTLPNELRQAEVALETAQLSLDRAAEQSKFAVQRAELDLADARAKLVDLQRPAKAADIEAARVAIQQAEINLQDVRNSTSAAKTQAELAVKQAANAVREAQQAYARTVELIGGTPGTSEEGRALEEAQRAVDNAQADLQSAEVAANLARQNEVTSVQDAESRVREATIALQKLQAGPDRADLAEAQRAIQRAQVALEEARASGQGDPEDAKQVEQAKLTVENTRARLESGRIYAPFDGQIAEISTRPGESVAAYKPVINIINPTEKDLVIDGTLTSDLQKIGIGQQVNITFSRYPTQPISGTVEKLPTTLTSTSSSVEADPAIHVSFPIGSFELDVGDISQVVVTLEQKPDALWLPPQAVRSFDNRRFVVVQDGQRQRRVDVKVGIVTLDRIEILEGLKEGDVVIGQ